VSKAIERLSDLKSGAVYTGQRMVNLSSGTWDKFMFGGKGTEDALAKPTEGDFELNNMTQIRALFNREAIASAYMTAVSSSDDGAGTATVNANLQGDMLASMQQAIGLRYSSRMRHMAAAASRLKSIGRMDAELLKLKVQNG
jgi:hypothetical protein